MHPGNRAALPNALIAVDGRHLVALANRMLTEVRQRVTRDQLGRRGRVADPVWVNRKLLLTGAEHLSTKQWKRLKAMLDSSDPTGEIGAALGCDGTPPHATERTRTVQDPVAAGRPRRRRPPTTHRGNTARSASSSFLTWATLVGNAIPTAIRPARQSGCGSG